MERGGGKKFGKKGYPDKVYTSEPKRRIEVREFETGRALVDKGGMWHTSNDS